MKFWNWGTTVQQFGMHNIEGVAFYFSKSLHPTVQPSNTMYTVQCTIAKDAHAYVFVTSRICISVRFLEKKSTTKK